jgi:hypothetical protein
VVLRGVDHQNARCAVVRASVGKGTNHVTRMCDVCEGATTGELVRARQEGPIVVLLHRSWRGVARSTHPSHRRPLDPKPLPSLPKPTGKTPQPEPLLEHDNRLTQHAAQRRILAPFPCPSPLSPQITPPSSLRLPDAPGIGPDTLAGPTPLAFKGARAGTRDGRWAPFPIWTELAQHHHPSRHPPPPLPPPLCATPP